jgi:hypothetical protein
VLTEPVFIQGQKTKIDKCGKRQNWEVIKWWQFSPFYMKAKLALGIRKMTVEPVAETNVRDLPRAYQIRQNCITHYNKKKCLYTILQNRLPHRKLVNLHWCIFNRAV